MTENEILTFYSSKPEAYAHLTERLEQAGYEISSQPIPNAFVEDPSIRKGDLLWQGEMNLAQFVLKEEEKLKK
jgi:hypothetical protein